MRIEPPEGFNPDQALPFQIMCERGKMLEIQVLAVSTFDALTRVCDFFGWDIPDEAKEMDNDVD